MKPDDASQLQPVTDTSVALAARLRSHTRGEVLFDAASRGRYATDASIYQVTPVGVFVPTDDADTRAAIQIARELKVPVLPRGAGTSQCGQTVGACLVIDGSKHLRSVLALDVDARTARVQPGLVLDHLNAQLKGHGLWFPVDVSTSAQATLGGMAGNNSCGSRSIAYGNMVHNVLGAHLRLADGGGAACGAARLARRPRGRHRALRARTGRCLPRRHRGALATRDAPRRRLQPRHLPSAKRAALHRRRLGQPGAPVRRCRGHARVRRGARPAAQRRCHAPRCWASSTSRASIARWTSAQHIVRLGPTAVELVDRTMIELARANPAFKPVIDSALIGAPAGDPAGRVQRRRPQRAARHAARAGRADGRSGSARQRGRDGRRHCRKRPCGRCARRA